MTTKPKTAASLERDPESPPVFQLAYNSIRTRPTVECTEDLTRQSDAAESNILTIMSRYQQTGVLPLPRGEAVAQFVDNTQAHSFESAALQVAQVRGQFSEMPEALRARFGSPEGLIDAMALATGEGPESEAAHAELVKLGVFEARTEPDLTVSERRDRKPRHSAKLDNAVPTDGGANASETDGQGVEPKGVSEKRVARPSEERSPHADARRDSALGDR